MAGAVILECDMLPSRQTSEIIKTCHVGGSIFYVKEDDELLFWIEIVSVRKAEVFIFRKNFLFIYGFRNTFVLNYIHIGYTIC